MLLHIYYTRQFLTDTIKTSHCKTNLFIHRLESKCLNETEYNMILSSSGENLNHSRQLKTAHLQLKTNSKNK